MAFVARTHPQQGPNEVVDDRATTWEVFNPLHQRFRFTIDAAASPHNTKLPRYWTRHDNGLTQPWAGERVWCNPPYSNVAPWVDKTWGEWGNGLDLAVLLLPSNRTEQRWWQELVEPYRDRPGTGLRTEFIAGRMRFIAHNDTHIRPNARPPFGVVLLIWGQE